MKRYSRLKTGDFSFIADQLTKTSWEVFFKLHQMNMVYEYGDHITEQKQKNVTIILIYSIYTKFYLSRQMVDKVCK